MPTPRRILCPIDFSAPSQRALAYATDLARAFGAEMLLVHVLPQSAYPTSEFAALTGFPDLRAEIRRRADAGMAAARASIDPQLAVRTEVREGHAYEQILQAAAEHACDLIVMATHGHTGLKHALLGSTAERVVRLAACPVLTVRAP